MYEELRITHLHGPLEVELSSNEAVVLCLVKDGQDLMEDFITHYRKIGFSHFVFLDNGSSDDTVAVARQHSNVTILRSLADFKEEKLSMKHALLRMFGVGTWTLIADIDELFHYPMMDRFSFDRFLWYLNKHRFTSVVAHLLDLMPPTSLKQLRAEPISRIGESAWYFNHVSIEKSDYDIASNVIENTDIKMWRGGVRSVLFNLNRILLTKHPLNFGDNRMAIHSNHTIGNRKVADISGLLMHYKFVGDIHERIRDAVNHGNFYRNSIEYRHYLEVIDGPDDTCLVLPDSVRFENHRTLLEHELFVISDQYLSELAT
ncbi:MAG: hypothetical protein DHS20C01_12240 [marine bacterium B5-7]|nr:MAG: hypothetical protein DHS20C01_12240 [marine bacterium B5-7]